MALLASSFALPTVHAAPVAQCNVVASRRAGGCAPLVCPAACHQLLPVRGHTSQPWKTQSHSRSVSSSAFAIDAASAVPADDSLRSDAEVLVPQQEEMPPHSLVDKFRQAAQKAAIAAQRFSDMAVRLATFVANSMVLSVAARIAHRQTLQRLAAEKAQQAKEKLQAAAQARRAAGARIQQMVSQRSKADRAYVKMLLSQDNPARTLDSKWRDLRKHMRSDQAPEFRRMTSRLFSAALDSSHAVQLAMKTEAAKGTKALDHLVSQHDCVKEEEALRSLLFAQMLNAQQS